MVCQQSKLTNFKAHDILGQNYPVPDILTLGIHSTKRDLAFGKAKNKKRGTAGQNRQSFAIL